MSLALLMRHGHYDQPTGVPSAHLPFGLTEAGRGHAREGAEALLEMAQRRGLRIAPVVDSSHLPRALQTAEIVADVLTTRLGTSFTVESFPALAERSVGAFANLTVEEIERILVSEYAMERPPSDWKRSPDFKLPGVGAESLSEAGRRVLEHVVARLAGAETIKVFVGHGGSFRHAAVHMNILTLGQAAELSMHYGGAVLLSRDPSSREWSHTDGQFKQRTSRRID